MGGFVRDPGGVVSNPLQTGTYNVTVGEFLSLHSSQIDEAIPQLFLQSWDHEIS